MNAMTLEQVRDWHRHQLNFLPESGVPTDLHQNAADAIDSHLAQPAQAVDVDSLAQEIRRVDGMHMLGAGALAEALMPFITRALTGEKAGPVGEIPMDDCVRSILGKPCFTLIHLANALRKDGHKIGHKAEDEQAVCLHWMLNLYLKHGTEWGKVATAEIERIHALPASPAPDKECQP